MKTYIGIDPGINKCGIAFITKTHIATETIENPKDINFVCKVNTILRHMEEQLQNWFFADFEIYCEDPYLPGKAHDNMKKLIGIIEFYFQKPRSQVQLIHPMSLKKYFGSGKLDKKELAQKLVDRKGIKGYAKYIKKLIEQEKWDETDALALAVYGKERR